MTSDRSTPRPAATEVQPRQFAAGVVRFGHFRLFVGRRELLLHDAPVRIGSRTLDVLVALVERQGELVSKDDLLAEVWPDRVVEENNLQAQISALRKVLAGDAQIARDLQTVPGRGYRFVARVDREEAARDAATAAAIPRMVSNPRLPLPDKPSIAVVPFTNLSSDPEQDYSCDGMTDDIVTELARFSEMFVIASNSSFKFKGSSFDVQHVGRELGVHYVLKGSIRKHGDRVRITAQLINAITGAHLWAEHYDRKMSDVFTVQDEVARTIASILVAHVGKAEVERTRAKPPPTWQAYDYYLQGRDAFAWFLASYRAVDLYGARQLLQSALAIDQNYARAHAVLSNIYLCAWLHSLDGDYLSTSVLERAHHIARKAVQLDPNLPVAHEHLGLVLTFMGRHGDLIAAFERATALNPNFANWRFGFALVCAGEAARAIKVMREITRLDPFYPAAAAGFFGFAYHMLKRYADALPWLRECTSRAPDFRGGHAWLAANYARLGKPDEARREIAEVLRLDPTFTIDGKLRRTTPFQLPDDAEHYFDGLRKAGLPER